ncbi:MAG: redox-sensing transcriptional repressor Rex [Clostridia bacterium]|nr:redox-sensing transcriptional repressor Rex [Clostridia bacterium]
MEQGNKKYISKAVIRRLSRYFRYLRELLNNGIMRISSKELSQKMGLTASQIRQDLNCFGGFGQQGYGYNVKYLYGEISKILGVEKKYNAIIVGIGNLGKALINTPMFERRGITVSGLFDIDPDTVGKTFGKHTVLHIDDLKEFFEKTDVAIGIITVPRTEAANTAENLAALGVKGLWNFSNAEIMLENYPDVIIENVHLGDSLMALSYEISKNG